MLLSTVSFFSSSPARPWPPRGGGSRQCAGSLDSDVGVAGQRVGLEDGQLVVNGHAVSEPYVDLRTIDGVAGVGTLAAAKAAPQRCRVTEPSRSQLEADEQLKPRVNALTVDAFAAWPLTRRLALEARAENLTDTRVVAGISGAGIIERGTPRTLWLGLRWRPDRPD